MKTPYKIAQDGQRDNCTDKPCEKTMCLIGVAHTIVNATEEAHAEAIEQAAALVDEVANRAIGRASAPIDLPWLAERIRQLQPKTTENS